MGHSKFLLFAPLLSLLVSQYSQAFVPTPPHVQDGRPPQSTLFSIGGLDVAEKVDEAAAKITIPKLLTALEDHRKRRKAVRTLMKKVTVLSPDDVEVLAKATCKIGNLMGCLGLLELLRNQGHPPSPKLYGDLLNLSCSRLSYGIAVTLLRQMRRENLSASQEQLANVISVCIKEERTRESCNVFEMYGDHKCVPSMSIAAMVILHCVKANYTDGISRVLQHLEKLGIQPDESLIGMSITGFGRSHKWEDILRLLQGIESRGLTPSMRTYSASIAGLLSASRTAEAKEVYMKATEGGVVFDAKSMGILAEVAGKCGNGRVAVFWLEEARKQFRGTLTIRAYRAAFQLTLDGNDLAAASNMLVSYAEDLGEVDATSFYSLFRACATPEEKEKAYNLYWSLSKAGTPVSSTCWTYKHLIDYLKEGRREEEIIALMDDAEARGVLLLPDTYSKVMYAYSSVENFQRVLSLYGTMKTNVRKPTTDIERIGWYHCQARVLFACGKLGDGVLAQEIFGQWQSGEGIIIKVTDYMSMIQAFAKSKMPDQALEVLRYLARKEKPTTVVYNGVINAMAKAQKMDAALELFQEMKGKGAKPDTTTFTLLISGFERSNNPKKATALYQEFLNSGLPLNLNVLTSALSAAAATRNITAATETMETLKDLGIEPSIVTYGAWINALSTSPGTYTQALEVLEDVKSKGLPVNIILYNEGLCACTSGVRKDASFADKAMALYEEMLQQRIEPDKLSYRRLLRTLRLAGRYEDVVKISETIPKDLLLKYDRLAVPVVGALLKVGKESEAMKVLGEFLFGEDNLIHYATYRWAVHVYCCKAQPVQVASALGVLEIMKEKGFKPDVLMTRYILSGYASLKDWDGLIAFYKDVPDTSRDSVILSLALQAYNEKGRKDMVESLLRALKDRKPFPVQGLVDSLLTLVGTGAWESALKTLELLLDADVRISDVNISRVKEALTQVKGPSPEATEAAEEILAGLDMLSGA